MCNPSRCTFKPLREVIKDTAGSKNGSARGAAWVTARNSSLVRWFRSMRSGERLKELAVSLLALSANEASVKKSTTRPTHYYSAILYFH